MISINNVPFVNEESEEYKDFIHTDCWGGLFLFKPIFECLPNDRDLDEEERNDYPWKNLKEGMYLVGMEIMTDEQFYRGHSSTLFHRFGLILDTANPVEVKESKFKIGNTMILMKFRHAVYQGTHGDKMGFNIKIEKDGKA